MDDCILIDGLEIFSRVGVTPAERENPQKLTVTLRLQPARPLANLGDDLRQTVDYAAACEMVRAHAAVGARQLIETLAEEIALLSLARFPLHAVEIQLCKYVVPGTRFVGVQLRREAPAKG